MKKNVASQLISAQMISATDGSNVTTGTCNVAVEIDGVAGTGGTATHVANGKWEYAPIQADTDGDYLTFQFVITGAITATIQVYPTFPQTVDNNVLAAGATGFAAIDTVVDTINTNVGTAGAGLTNIGTVATVTNVTNDYSKYEGGRIWYDEINGSVGTTSFVDGITTDPSSNEAAVGTLLTNTGLRQIHCMPGSTFTLAGGFTYTGYVWQGTGWSLSSSGSRAISDCTFIGATSVGGTFTAVGRPTFIGCNFDQTLTLPASDMRNCSFGSNTTTLTTGNYDFIDCQSIVAGTGAPPINCNSPGTAQNLSFRRWSGGLELQGITTNTTVSIDAVSGGTITLTGSDGTVAVRGNIAAVDDQRTGNPVLTRDILSDINEGIIYGSCTGTPSSTSTNTDLTGYENSELIGRVIIFTGGTADGQAATITSYTQTSGVVGFDALTTTAVANDTFKIV